MEWQREMMKGLVVQVYHPVTVHYLAEVALQTILNSLQTFLAEAASHSKLNSSRERRDGHDRECKVEVGHGRQREHRERQRECTDLGPRLFVEALVIY